MFRSKTETREERIKSLSCYLVVIIVIILLSVALTYEECSIRVPCFKQAFLEKLFKKWGHLSLINVGGFGGVGSKVDVCRR